MNYFVYKTTNTINNKFYIGVHNGKKPNYINSKEHLGESE